MLKETIKGNIFMNNNYAIGVFDSGMGGLTAVKELNALMPEEDVIYFGDTARIPYGCRSRETVLRYAAEDIAFLQKHRIKMIIAACGTVSSVIGDNSPVDNMPFTGVVLPAAKAACEATKSGKIGVIGTSATIKSQSFVKAIKNIMPDAEVIGNACPLFVHLVENGYTAVDCKITRLAAEEYLEPIKKENVDTLILGCTHYPVIKDIIADIMGNGVTLISPGAEAAKYAFGCLKAENMLNNSGKIGKNIFYVSDSKELFEENAGHFLEHPVNGEVFSCNLGE